MQQSAMCRKKIKLEKGQLFTFVDALFIRGV